MKCKAIRTKQKSRCTQEAKYGVLCPVHARQLSATPNGFQMNRIIRTHYVDVTEQEREVSILEYVKVKGGSQIQNPAKPASYVGSVLEFVKREGEVTASQIVDYVKKLSPYDMTASKVGTITQTLLARGQIVRRVTSIEGRSGSIYSAN